MKKALTIGTVSPIVLTASMAFAAGGTYTGTIFEGVKTHPNGSVRFKTVVREGVIKKVKGFGWDGVSVSCRGPGGFSGVSSRGSFGQAMRVRRKTGKFHGTRTGPTGTTVKIIGRFKKDERRALGTFQILGDIDPAHTNCATGILLWSAKRK